MVKILATAENRIKVQITDIDANITETALKEEIVQNLEHELDIKIESLKPVYGEMQTGIVQLRKTPGTELVKKGRIKIGIVMCRVIEYVQLRRCYRCWSPDHMAARCNGPDRSKHCLKYGGLDHMVAACKENSYCPLCERAGHRAGSGACPKMRLMFQKFK